MSPSCNVCERELNGITIAKQSLVKFCKDVCNIMINIADIDIPCSISSCNNLCFLMKFWIYEYLMKITTEETEVKSFYNALKSIIYGDPTKWNICNINFYMEKDDFIIFKYIYDFLYTYKDMRNEISKKYDTEVKLYCIHIKEFLRYYNNIKGNCNDSEKCVYYYELDKFKNVFTYGGELDYIYNNCKYEKTACTSNSIEEEIPCLKEKEYKYLFSMEFDDTHNIISIISYIAILIIPILGLLSIFIRLIHFLFEIINILNHNIFIVLLFMVTFTDEKEEEYTRKYK
ncbi:hypothetical protein PCYB_007350 [Plasmodium cynomolgi strain B]|uniref:Uncharacterized protein n=1 Tax=Plasmodium cynomolgi (strain B) TaxID=1120755 RepID=K6UFF0_PLACD|nr:hypothetical protein PCYB_007350 [Plasmodium cynomolgi strain B]GAB69986.1 hypothetical protein PCYB_007350 [Plasmodium cynomolgi strain B]